MAQEKHVVEAGFKDNLQLQQFVLESVTPTGNLLGSGSYGSVEEVKYNHLLCAGKKLHETLINADNEEEMVAKYLQECQLMASLRHPNITQFLGLCFLPGSPLPLLVMEKSETSLNDLLEHMPNLPLSLKRSVLEDIASGLLYLHDRPSPVIHRDLTAKNVLLTSSLVAKITDMGNSRIVDMRPGQMARTLSQFPGTLVYMPPEALDDTHRYGPSLDIFSFGHLALYILIQIFPYKLLSSTYYKTNDTTNIHPRTEVERRGNYINILEGAVGHYHPVLVKLTKGCLHNAPQERPTADKLLYNLRKMKADVEGRCNVNLTELDMARVRMAKEGKRKDRRIEELEKQQENLTIECMRVTTKLEETRTELKARENTIQELRDEVQRHNREISTTSLQAQQLSGEVEARIIEERDGTIQLLEKQIENVTTVLPQELLAKGYSTSSESNEARLKTDLQSKEAENRRLREELGRCHMLLQHRAGQVPTKQFRLELSWREGPEIPMEIRGYVQSAVIEGKLYVGGGHIGRGSNDKFVIFEYNTCSEKWNKLISYIACDFAMTTIENQLVLVGGEDHGRKSKKLGTWHPESNDWIYPYREMPTARSDCSVVHYKEWLIVAGGISDFGVALSNIEIMNTTNTDMEWHTGLSTPTSWAYMRAVTVGDSCYFVGGSTGKFSTLSGVITDKAYSVFLPDLIGQLNSRNSRSRDKQIKKEMWKKIQGLQIGCSIPLSVGGSLLVVGGRKDKEAVAAIHFYQPETNFWHRVGDMPIPRYDCICTMLTESEMLVAGGYNHGMVKRVDIATVKIEQ